MACKGYKHPPDCECKFPYGNSHPEENLPRRAAKSFAIFATKTVRHFEPKLKVCPHCGELIYYKTFSPGQTGVFVFGRVNLRHKCPATPYEPFTQKHRPRLRQVLEQYQKEGWLPLFESVIEADILGKWLKGLTLSSPTERKLPLPDDSEIDLNELIYFRTDVSNSTVSFRFFDLKKQMLVEVISKERR